MCVEQLFRSVWQTSSYPRGWVGGAIQNFLLFHLVFSSFSSPSLPPQQRTPTTTTTSPPPARERLRISHFHDLLNPEPASTANEKNTLPPRDVRKLHLRLLSANPTLPPNAASKSALHRIYPSPRSTAHTAARLLRPPPIALNSRPLPA